MLFLMYTIAMNSITLTLKYVFVDLIGGIIWAPIWWYTAGLKLMMVWAAGSVKSYAQSISLSVWIKNLFVPMYGQYDWQSRIISVFMRFVMIIGRMIALFIWLLVVMVMMVAYLALPPLAISQIIFHLFGSLL